MTRKRKHDDCPVGTAVFIRSQAKKLGMSVVKVRDEYSEESGIPSGTLDSWLYPSKKKLPEKSGKDKVLRKQTKPEVREQLGVVAEAIESGEVADDDVRVVSDSLAGAIDSGTVAPRAGSKVATAVKKAHRKGVVRRRKEPDNFKRLWKHVLSTVEGLTFFADGTIQPETPDEVNAAKGILEAAQSFIVQYARLGVDIIGTYETFVTPKEAKDASSRRKEVSAGSN